MTLPGERPALKKLFEYPPEKTRKLEFYIRPVETRTTSISGGNNPRFVIHVAHVSLKYKAGVFTIPPRNCSGELKKL